MLAELQQLLDLYELDKELLAITQDLERLPQELRDLGQEMEELEAERASRLQELDDLQSRLREMEAEVADLETAIRASRERLMEITKELEMKAMLKEIAFREDQRDQKETRVLELLDQVEALKQVIADQEQSLKTLKKDYDRRAAEVAAQTAELERQKQALMEKREALRGGLPAPLLKRYEFILSRRNGSAISEVRAGVCLACHMNILPQQFIDLQKGEEIVQCPHCQRILYWLGEDEDEEGAEAAARKVS
ncbi:MAG: zinc ribbon domain-containing protein [Desulfobaccales bacterium]